MQKNSKDIFGTVICVGFISNLLFSIMQNIGMTMGLMPITGITLPFMSYGGSSLLTSFYGTRTCAKCRYEEKENKFLTYFNIR